MQLIKYKIILSTIVLLLLLFQKSFSQDFHLSQYDAAALYLNPALTASYFNEKVDYRIYSGYRSQWKSVSGNPFSTSFLAIDRSYNRFGAGVYIINNHSGTGGFNSFNFMFSGSYQIIDSKQGPHFLSVGLQAGIINKSFNPDKFTFDNQYSTNSGSGFDENISSNEFFDKTSLLKFDANMGIHYKHKTKYATIHPFAGLSVFHLTMPDESFTQTEKRLPIRFVLNGGSDIMIKKGFRITPSILYMNQGKATELNGGILAFYNINDSYYDVVFGLNYRLEDALIIQCGIKQDGHIFRISYDINTSYLNNFSGNKGGIEFSLIFSGRKKQSLFQF